MAKRTIVLKFPQHLVDQPVTYKLIANYGLVVNILSAKVTPQEEGNLVVGVEGPTNRIKEGIKYLQEVGVEVQSLAQDMVWDEQKCTHCTECVPLCPTRAFTVEENSMEVNFNKEYCIACGMCVKVCPYDAVSTKLA